MTYSMKLTLILFKYSKFDKWKVSWDVFMCPGVIRLTPYYAVDAQKNCLNKTVLLSKHSII